MFGVDDIVVAAIASAVVGAAASSAGAAVAADANRRTANSAADKSLAQSKDLAQWQATELPALQLQGMKKAGLSPILAYDNIGSSSVPVLSPVKADSGFGGLSNLGKIFSEIPEKMADVRQKGSSSGYLDNLTEMNNARIQLERQQANAQIRLADSQISLNQARALSEAGVPQKMQKELAYYDALINHLNYDNKQSASVDLGPLGRWGAQVTPGIFGKLLDGFMHSRALSHGLSHASEALPGEASKRQTERDRQEAEKRAKEERDKNTRSVARAAGLRAFWSWLRNK